MPILAVYLLVLLILSDLLPPRTDMLLFTCGQHEVQVRMGREEFFVVSMQMCLGFVKIIIALSYIVKL